MRSGQLGKFISAVEVTNVSQHGFWLPLEGRELFLPFEQFPWFRDVSIGQLLNVQLRLRRRRSIELQLRCDENTAGETEAKKST